MKVCASLVSAVVILVTASTAHSQLLYWDTNGATAGSTNTPPNAPGTWNAVAANWTTSSSGTSATQAWAPNATAVFSAGTDATGTFDVTLSGTQSAGGLAFQDGAVTITGGTGLTLTGGGQVSVGPASPVTGDHNGDGVVDAADYVAWRKDPAAFGGDPAGYDSWRTNFGTIGGSATLATINSVIGGSAGLTKSGSGTLVLSGANTYTGNTTMTANSGILKLAAANTLPATTVLDMPGSNGGALVELHNGGIFYNQTVAGVSGGGSGTTSPTIIDIGKATLTIDVPTGQSHTYNGYLKTDFTSPTDRGKVIKKGDGDLTLGGLNNSVTLGMAGEFSMEAGRLLYTNNVGTGGNNASAPSQLTLKGGTIVKALADPATSLSITPRTLEIAGSFSFDMNGSTANGQILPSAPGGGLGGINLTASNPTITVNSGVAIPNATTALPYRPTFVLSGIITDGANSFGLTKAGSGILTLDRVNTYDGTTTVTEGAVRVTAAVGSGNTLQSTIGNGTTSPIVLSGGSLEWTGALVNGTRVGIIDNPVTMTASSGIGHGTGGGAGGLTTSGGPIDFLFSNFTATAGTLTLYNEGTSNEPNIGAPFVNPLEFRVGFTASGFNFTQPVVVQNHTNVNVPNRTTSLMSSNTSGSHTFSGVISGNGGYVRNGAGGTSILTANNTYTGDTKVLAGTLSITNPYLADTADVLLTTGSFLNLDFVGVGTTDTIDQLFIDGSPVATGTWGAPLSGAANTTPSITGDGWLLVTASGSSPGAVPEPGTLMLAIMTVFAFGGMRRRRGSL